MNGIIKRLIISIITLAAFNMVCMAKDVHGFIITSDSDTVYGIIKLHRNNLNSAGVILKGIDMESCYSSVEFMADGDRKFLTYTPDQIQGYGFTYDLWNYIFRSFSLEMKNAFGGAGEQPRFLNLIYRGEFSLYKDLIRDNVTGNNNKSMITNDNLSYSFYVYYIYNEITGLIKVQLTKDIKTYSELLKFCGMNKEFVDSIPEVKNIGDIIEALKKYNNR